MTATAVLHVNVTWNVIISGNKIKLPIEDLEQLQNYIPF